MTDHPALRGLTVLALALGACLVASPSADAATPTCEGRAATVVGAPGQPVVGTPGDDVVVATDPTSVDVGAGDDLVCVLNSGAGYLRVTVALGAGADTYQGPDDAISVVDAGDADDVAAGAVPSVDHITTGDGNDLVTTGVDGSTDADVIDLGDAVGGRNRLRLSGVPTGSFASGSNVEAASDLRLTDGRRHDWAIDLQTGTVTVDGGTPAAVSGFTSLTARDLTWSHLEVTGTDDADDVDLGGPQRGRGPVSVHTGAGEDSVGASGTLRGTLDLGRGGDHRRHEVGDTVYLVGRTGPHPSTDIALRLGRGARVDGHAGLRVRNAEAVDLHLFATIRLTGTSAAEDLSARGCSVQVSGRGGADRIDLHRATGCRHHGGVFAAYGDAGPDRLTGTPGPDRLIGGPGLDRACGDGGHDVIVAERRC